MFFKKKKLLFLVSHLFAMNQQTKSFNIRNVNTRFKLFTLYVGLVTILVVVWIQVDGFSHLNFNQPEDPNDPAYFPSSEMDPATWSIQIQENEPILSQRSIFPANSFSLETSLPLVTAVVSRVDDSHEGIMQAVRHLLKYPFIKEIYVYNQIKSKPLTAEVKIKKRKETKRGKKRKRGWGLKHADLFLLLAILSQHDN